MYICFNISYRTGLLWNISKNGELAELNATAVVLPYKVKHDGNWDVKKLTAFHLQGDRHSLYIYIPKEIDGLERFRTAFKNASMEEIRRYLSEPRPCQK